LRNFTEADKEVKSEILSEIGILFQGGALFDSKNVEENVRFPLDILTTMPLDEKMDRVNFCLKRVGLENVNKKMASEISGGMKKRVGIARAMVNNPNYLFCDETNWPILILFFIFFCLFFNRKKATRSQADG
jgi:phospholipid/cholesterol/gamma-HCH transport system ATP-binding protein